MWYVIDTLVGVSTDVGSHTPVVNQSLKVKKTDKAG